MSNIRYNNHDTGVGKAVLVAALAAPYKFKKVWGIEIVPDLCTAANTVKYSLLSRMSVQAVDKQSDEDFTPHINNREIDNLKELLSQILDDAPGNKMRADTLVNLICKRLGHKKYKESLKSYKSFRSFVECNQSEFLFHPEENFVYLVSHEFDHPELLEAIISKGGTIYIMEPFNTVDINLIFIITLAGLSTMELIIENKIEERHLNLGLLTEHNLDLQAGIQSRTDEIECVINVESISDTKDFKTEFDHIDNEIHSSTIALASAFNVSAVRNIDEASEVCSIKMQV